VAPVTGFGSRQARRRVGFGVEVDYGAGFGVGLGVSRGVGVGVGADARSPVVTPRHFAANSEGVIRASGRGSPCRRG
jgi:hypothetical protein